MNEVIVIGGNHHNTLAILRSLGERGVMPSLIVLTGDRKPFTTYSKYIKKSIVLNSYEGLQDAMFALAGNDSKPVVIACSDKVSSFLDQNRDKFSPFFILPGAVMQGRITSLMNKEIMSDLAFKSGMNIPKSWVVDIKDCIIDKVEYPCIVKPLVSIAGSKNDIFVCYNKIDLENFLKTIKCEKVQIQKYIDKSIEYQLIGCSLNGGEQIIIPGASVILRQPKNTNTGFLKYLPKKYFPFNEEDCKRFIKATGYSGLFSLEFLKDKDGVDYFMEINFRNDGNSICVTASGMNLPYIWYLHCCGHAIDSELSYDNMKEVYVMPEFDDFHFVKTGELSLFKWIKDIRKTDRFMEFSKDDQKPFWQKLKKLILIRLKLIKQINFD